MGDYSQAVEELVGVAVGFDAEEEECVLFGFNVDGPDTRGHQSFDLPDENRVDGLVPADPADVRLDERDLHVVPDTLHQVARVSCQVRVGHAAFPKEQCTL